MAKEKKGQKFGRAARRPSTAAYKLGKRSEVNAERRKRKELARQAAPKQMRVPRGTARAKRRKPLQVAYATALLAAQPLAA